MVAVEADIVVHIGLRVEDLADIREAVVTVVEDRLHILLGVTDADDRVVEKDWFESTASRILEDKEVRVACYEIRSAGAWKRVDPVEDRVLEFVSVALAANSIVEIKLGALVVVKTSLKFLFL